MPATKRTRSQKRKTVPFTCHITPQEKAEVQRKAKVEGISASQVGKAYIGQGIRQDLHQQHAVLLQPIIEEAIRKEMTKYSTRLALLLVRVAFEVGMIRILTIKILRRKQVFTNEVLDKMLDESVVAAKGNITRKTPQMQTVIDEVKSWFQGEERTAEAHG